LGSTTVFANVTIRKSWSLRTTGLVIEGDTWHRSEEDSRRPYGARVCTTVPATNYVDEGATL
jgi:hypothetical protein